MQPSFKCRIQYNSDIPKIKKFFEEAETMGIAAGKAGIALFTTTSNDVVYYIVEIHACDIYQLYVDESSKHWQHGGIVRTMSAISFNSFIKTKEVNDDLQFEIDSEGTELKLCVMDSNNEIRSTSIQLTKPKIAHEYPIMTFANVVIKVNEFKSLCSTMSKASSEILIQSQPQAVRIQAGESKISYGNWNDSLPMDECYIKNTAFLKATKINIGNTKNSQAGLYIHPKYPILIKVKLGIVDFLIYSKKSIDIK